MKVRIIGTAHVQFSIVVDMSDDYDPRLHEPELDIDDVYDGATELLDVDIDVNEIEEDDDEEPEAEAG